MAETVTQELNELFGSPNGPELGPAVLGELQSILRLHSIAPQELFYKWESYCIRMGPEETKLTLETARSFKADVQEILERENRGKSHLRSTEKKGGTGGAVGATPRNIAAGDYGMDMLDSLVPNTPKPGSARQNNTKRKAGGYETPATKEQDRTLAPSSGVNGSTPSRTGKDETNGVKTVSFADRPNAGQIVESLNDHLVKPEAPIAPAPESRVKLTANTDLKKFSYRPMIMHLSETSEILDDRIDEFYTLVQSHHDLTSETLGNPATQGTNELVAVGRIASDAPDGKPNASSLVLETSRRMGAGARVPLKVDEVGAYEFFPGQIVALRGINASGSYFAVREVLDLPLLPNAASTPAVMDSHRERLRGGPEMMYEDNADPQPLNLLVGSGPYTADDNLAFEPLGALCDKAASEYADALILSGPFLDVEHPLLASGDFDLPEGMEVDDEDATMSTAFRGLVATHFRRLAAAVPNITIILVPSVRDLISKHVSWPQEPFPKRELGLPKQVRIVTNPVTLSLNELVVGISAQDILSELRVDEVLGPKPKSSSNLLARLPRHLIEQRHFSPLFPPVKRDRLLKSGVEGELATGAMLDPSYLKLGEWLNVRPDVLITPSTLPPFAKVVESVLVVNPGTASKRKAPGTLSQMTIYPLKITHEERAEGKLMGHRIYERARVDICRI